MPDLLPVDSDARDVPARLERAAGASGRSLAMVETEEIQTRLDHLYLFAEDLELAKDALRCMKSVYKQFQETGPTQDKEAPVSTRDMLAAADSTLKFYALVNSTLKKRTLTKSQTVGTTDQTIQRLQDVQARIIELQAKKGP